MVQNIHIQINRFKNYTVGVKNSLTNNVTVYEPYDKLSKKFNRYTHKILYPSQAKYDPKDYVLCLDDPNAWYYAYILYLYEPSKKIVSVDIFFQSSDTEKRYPLLFGFNYENDPSIYYTYYYLRGVKYFKGSIGSRGLIEKGDLITKLIEERGLHVSESYNKFIIRLADKPNKSEVKYPNGGHNTKRITLKKSEPREYPNFVKYEHEINKLNNVQSFYISFHQDTLFMNSDGRSGKLKDVDVYYNKHDGDVPVVIVFKFERHTRLYKFSDFYSDVSKKSKNISLLELFSEGDLTETLINEYKKVKKEITFYKGKQENQYISLTSDRFFMDNKDQFRRAILRPNLDSSKGGDPTGPYVVYNDNLFQKYSKTKINNESILEDVIGKKFGSIYVYYTTNNEPLLVGFIGESVNQFFRISKGGQSWEKDNNNINIYNIGHLIYKLRQLEKEKNDRGSVPVKVKGPSQEILQKPGLKPPPSTKWSPDPRHPARPYTPPIIKEPEIVTIKIDISNTTAGTYDSKKVQIDKFDYDDCDLFCYYLHTPLEQNFNKISFESRRDSKNISIDYFKENKFESVSVYFNRENLTKPLIMKIITQNGEKYYRNLIKREANYSVEEDITIDSKLSDTLIEENDKVHSTITYQMDKTTTKGKQFKYGHNNSIDLSIEEKESHGFSIFTHKYSGRGSSKGYVLFNKKVLLELGDNIKTTNSIQNKTYKEIKAYFLNNDTNLPLMVELTEASTKSYYSKIGDKKEEHWRKLSLSSSTDDTIKSNLIEINYSLKSSAIIEIDKKHLVKDEQTSYPMKIISNKKTSGGQYEEIQFEKSKAVHSSNVEVSHSNKVLDSSNRGYSPYIYVSHQLDEFVRQSVNTRDIVGLRLFLTIGMGIKPEEIYFYDSEDDANKYKNRINFYYPPQSDSHRIFVYFFDEDPRPLLVCYNGYAYKRLKNDDHTKWVRVKNIKKCFYDAIILVTLKAIYEKMAKQIVFRKGGKDSTKIKISTNQKFNTFLKDTYNPDVSKQGLFILPKNTLLPKSNDLSNINNLLNQLNDQTFSSVNVYKTGTGNTLKEILLFEFVNESRTIHLQRKDIEAFHWVNEQIKIENSKTIQEQLLVIKSKVEKTILYEIDKKDDKYNSYISLNSNWFELSRKFIQFTHSPLTNYSKCYGYFLHKGQRLMVKKSNEKYEPLDVIQNVEYKNISVYFSSRNYDIPLIIEFTQSNNSSSKSYYKHIKYKSRSYWQLIQVKSPLVSTKLTSELQQVEFSLVESVVILMDIKRNRYGDIKIRDAINKLTNKKEINTYPMDDECISVNDKTYEIEETCIALSGYVVYEHNLYGCIKENHTCSLRFFIPTSSSNNYKELNFYDGSSLDTLFYSKPGGDGKVYIYFYNGSKNTFDQIEDNDPRPLLVSYDGVAYKPKGTDGYFERWYTDSSITDFLCQRSGRNPELITALSTVVGFLNEVQLHQRPYPTYMIRPKELGSEIITYNLQTYNNKLIKIQVSYHNGSCFRSYRHEPYGIYGPGHGYRLGNIFYEKKQNQGLNYEISKQLKAVNVYYFVYDYNHNYPLFISLEYKEGRNKDYFELNDKREKKWRKSTENIDEYNIESTIKSLIKKLDIDFNTGNDAMTLFDSNECYDDNDKTTIIAAASGGTVTTAALVGGGVTAVVRPEWFIPVIRALV